MSKNKDSMTSERWKQIKSKPSGTSALVFLSKKPNQRGPGRTYKKEKSNENKVVL